MVQSEENAREWQRVAESEGEEEKERERKSNVLSVERRLEFHPLYSLLSWYQRWRNGGFIRQYSTTTTTITHLATAATATATIANTIDPSAKLCTSHTGTGSVRLSTRLIPPGSGWRLTGALF